MRVLQVEDDDDAARAIERLLEAEGHSCKTTAYGVTAVELALASDYDLILLDITLPDVNGFEVLRELRDQQIQTPVIIQSGLIGRDQVVQGISFGVHDYLVKPFNGSELHERIASALGLPEDSTLGPDSLGEHQTSDSGPGYHYGERRPQQPQQRTGRPANIVFEGNGSRARTISCAVIVLSDEGAGLNFENPDNIPHHFALQIVDGPRHKCELCWQAGNKVGVRFIAA